MQQYDIIVKNGTILTMDNENSVFENGRLCVKGDIIAKVGDMDEGSFEAKKLIDVPVPAYCNTDLYPLPDNLANLYSTKNLFRWQVFYTREELESLITERTGEDIGELLDIVTENLPERPPDFPLDQITDLYEREIAAELIREACLIFLRHEVPHSIAIRVDEFTERGEKGAYIAATIFVERDSQKGIVIGEGGKTIKKISTAARKEIEAMSGRKVFIRLRVKVLKDWRNNENYLRRFGYKPPKERK